MDLLQHIDDSIQSRALFRRGEKVLVAVSGGLDSMVLLHALKTLSVKHRWQLVVAHFNHQLRGRASDGDQRLACRTAADMGLPVVVAQADVKQFARRSKFSIEMAARKLRHEFFARAARERKIKTIALAHHADDQVELFFLRLLRGAGGQGLAGMKWKSPSPADKNILLVRPLLDLPKGQLQAHVRENKIRFRDDATNLSMDFLRNRVRHELLPRLQADYQPALSKTVLRVMEIIGTESELVRDMAHHFGGGRKSATSSIGYRLSAIGDFNEWPVAIQRRVLQSRLMDAGIAADFESIETLRLSAGTSVSIGPNLSIRRDAAGKVTLHPHQPAVFNPRRQKIRLGRAGKTVFSGTPFQWKLAPKKPLKFKSRQESFDAVRVGKEIVLRHWQPGDRFQPIGLKAAAKLQDLFINAKIPREQRHERVVATTSGGEIFWVEGLRIGDAFKLTPGTRQCLFWNWTRNLR